MTFEEMKVRKEKLEKELAELNVEMVKHEDEIHKGKLNKAIALLEECGYYYDMYAPVGGKSCYNCNEYMEFDFGDIIEVLKNFQNEVV